MTKNKNKNKRKISAWEMKQISQDAANKKGEDFLLKALEVCKERAKLGYGYAVYNNGLREEDLRQLNNLGYSISVNYDKSVIIKWNNAQEIKKNDNSKKCFRFNI